LEAAIFVPHALRAQLALELGEGQHHVQRQPAHRGGGVEVLGDRDESHAVLFKDLDQLGEVHQGAGQAVDLVDHDAVDLAGLDVGQQALQGGPLQGTAGEAAVVVTVGHQDRALAALAGHVGLAGVPLGVEGVERHIEALVGRLARIEESLHLESWAKKNFTQEIRSKKRKLARLKQLRQEHAAVYYQLNPEFDRRRRFQQESNG
jgi:hypothetical protein